MVGILAALAIPSINYQMKSNRTYRAAQEVALLFRQARVRAMGRGSAVLFRYVKGADGNPSVVEVREAITPAVNGSCQQTRASCQDTLWRDDSNDNQVVSTFRAGTGPYEHIALQLQEDANSALALGDFCFTPLGRLYFRTQANARFAPLPAATQGPLSVLVERDDGVSFSRRVLLPLNGASSVIAVPR